MLNITQHVMEHLEEGNFAEQRVSLNYVVTSARRLSSLIDDIIDFQSIKTGSLRLNSKRVDISAPLNLVLEVLGQLFSAKQIAIQNHVHTGQFFVTGDEDRIRQIIYNLVGNALKYTHSGMLVITSETVNNEVIMTFTDTGVGIDSDKYDDIFNFYEYYETHVREGMASSGLGLPIAKKLAEQMGGQLWLKSSTPKVGSVFAFKLPKDCSTATKESARVNLPEQHKIADRLQPDSKPTGKYSILVVDDDATNLKVITDIFSGEGIFLHTALNGEQALKIISDNADIALVLLDMMMPGMSGIEVCRRIRENHSLFDLPVLILTVKNLPEDIAAGLDAGANDYLTKPFDAREMLARAKTLIRLKEAVHELVTSEMSFLKAQIKPHFIYNAMSVIAALITEEPYKAKQLLFDLTDYLRGSFRFENYDGLVPLRDELETVNAYLSIEKARFGERLQIEYDINEEIDTLIPLLVIQPLVENAVRHGVMKREEGGTVRLSIRKRKGEILISVADNGAGVEKAQTAELLTGQHSKKGVGLSNINRRLRLYYGRELRFESEFGKGTCVTMKIPERKAGSYESNIG
jgi:signal transduction histidine kinase